MCLQKKLLPTGESVACAHKQVLHMLCRVRASEGGSSDLQLAHEDVPSCFQDLKHDVGLQVSAEVGHLIAQAVAVAQLKPHVLHTCSIATPVISLHHISLQQPAHR